MQVAPYLTGQFCVYWVFAFAPELYFVCARASSGLSPGRAERFFFSFLAITIYIILLKVALISPCAFRSNCALVTELGGFVG